MLGSLLACLGYEGRALRGAVSMMVIMLATATTAFGQWAKLNAPQLASVALYDTRFVSLSVGYAIGIDQRRGGTFIYKTTDGGNKWRVMSGLGLAPASFTFFDENNGVAGGLEPGCRCMAVAHTTNGGATWAMDSIRSTAGTVDSIPGYGVNSMSFADARTGYGVGVYGAIIKTTDGGARWERLNTGNTTDFVSEVWSPTPETAYAIAAPSIDSASYIFYRTSDGGKNWQRIYNFIDSTGFQDVCFVTPDVGFVGGWTADNGAIHKTTDGGRHWRRVYTGGSPGDGIFGLEFENETVGYAVGAGGMILRTSDGGASWVREASGTDVLLPNLSIVDGAVFAVGLNGTVLRRGVDASSVDFAAMSGEGMMMPNPMTTSATLRHPGLRAEGGHLVLFDMLGREVRCIRTAAGSEVLRFDRGDLRSGTYLYRLIGTDGVLLTGTIEVR